MAKIGVIGTTSYQAKMQTHKEHLESNGHECAVPAFDSKPNFNELQICQFNRNIIEWADEIHIFWDQRSMGTIFDLGMAFALRKPIKVVYLERKTFANVMKLYEESINGMD